MRFSLRLVSFFLTLDVCVSMCVFFLLFAFACRLFSFRFSFNLLVVRFHVVVSKCRTPTFDCVFVFYLSRVVDWTSSPVLVLHVFVASFLLHCTHTLQHDENTIPYRHIALTRCAWCILNDRECVVHWALFLLFFFLLFSRVLFCLFRFFFLEFKIFFINFSSLFFLRSFSECFFFLFFLYIFPLESV